MAEATEEGAGNGQSETEDITGGLDQLKISAAGDEDDTDLFGPPPPRDECPICMLPFPLNGLDSMYMGCCGKLICCGCMMQNGRIIDETNRKNSRRNRDHGRAPLQRSCPFCREPMSVTHEDFLAQLEKRVELNDAVALNYLAFLYRNGELGLPKDERKAFELFLRSADLGCLAACNEVASYYRLGEVAGNDEEKERTYLEMGAKSGNAVARHNLGLLEWRSGNVDFAVKNWLISAGAGYQRSLDSIKHRYKEGNVSKDDFARVLRSFQAAGDEERSEERDRWSYIWAAGKARIQTKGV